MRAEIQSNRDKLAELEKAREAKQAELDKKMADGKAQVEVLDKQLSSFLSINHFDVGFLRDAVMFPKVSPVPTQASEAAS